MWGPLTGCTVGITGHRRWEEQAEMLRRRGAEVLHGPVLHTAPLDDSTRTLDATAELLERPPDVVVLTTGVGVRSWFAAAESAGLDDGLRRVCEGALVLARGPKARSAAIGAGVSVHWQAVGETGAEIRDHLAAMGVAARRVAVQRDGGDPRLAESIAALGADVVDVPVYRWGDPGDDGPARRLVAATVAGRVHAVTFTSAPAVHRFFELADDPDALVAAFAGPARAVAVGPVTAAALRDAGVDRVVEPERGRLGAMVKALVAALCEEHRRLRWQGAAATWQGAALLHGDGTVAALTPAEHRLLQALTQRPGAVVAKAGLAADGADTHAVEAAVARLRTKLGPLGGAVRTVPRRGYACDLTTVPAD